MSEARSGRVDCDRHGEAAATYVCRHLVESSQTGKHVGFFVAKDSFTPRPDAWCRACEFVRISHGGEWNDDSEGFAGVTLLCGSCYDEVRARNERPRS